MKFETKLTKLNIDENEVKSIIANCFCGEINGAYLIDLTKIRKMEIMEVIGNHINYLERYDYTVEEETEWDFSMKFKTFCKAFQIENDDEVADLFVEGFNECGCDIAYRLESNKDIILVLTDDERYYNSFIKYSPSQTGEIDQYQKEMEDLEAEYIRLGELEPTKEPLQIFEDETEDVPTTKTCRVILRNKGAKYYCGYNDIHKLTESEIEFLNSRNTNNNILSKLELLYEKESLEDAFEEFCPGSQHGNLRILIAKLKEIQERNGKISISKDFKYTIEITMEEDNSSSNIGFDETTGIQYEIMTDDQKTKDGYVPSIEELIAEAPNEAMATAWKEVRDLIERTKDSDFPFAFAFRCVYTHQKRDGSYTIYQHGYPEDWTVEQCREKLLQWFDEVESQPYP